MAAADLNAIRAIVEARFLEAFVSDPIVTQNSDLIVTQSGLILVVQSSDSDIATVFANNDYSPTAQTSWVQCITDFSAGEHLTMGLSSSNPATELNGRITINIFTPQGSGPGANYSLGDQVCRAYTRQIDNQVFFAPVFGPSPVSPSNPAGFFQTQISVDFKYVEQL